MGHLVLALFTPLVFASLALAFAAYSLRKFPRVVCLAALSLLLFFSSGAGSNLLLKSLEWRYEGQSVDAAPAADGIVVLGGYLRRRPDAGRSVALGSATDRLWCAAELYHAGKAPVVLLTGGSAGPVPEAIAAGGVLRQWGVPPSAILTEAASRDTRQNAVFSQRILAQHRLTRILLVTSASHMQRASATFRRIGITVYPFAADFLAGDANEEPFFYFLPTANALAGSGLALKEWLGMAAYHLAGWA